jgi:hypothetical protein
LIECGVTELVTGLTLGHTIQKLPKTYNQHPYIAEMRDALQRWDAHLMGVCGGL